MNGISLYQNKNFVREKGFNYASETFHKVIDERGWSTFCKQLIKICALILKEFYVKLNKKVETDIYVWGKRVHLKVDEIHKALWSRAG